MKTDNQNCEINIIYHDSECVVIEKPSGLLSVRGRGEVNQHCAAEIIRKKFPACIEYPAVHRLDMDTSGLLVFALTKESYRNLSKQFIAGTVDKVYEAIIEGIPTQSEGVIELAFRLDPHNRPYQIYDSVNGKIGKTLWRLISNDKSHSRIELIPMTGRTHQLRLHMAHPLGLHCPIVGDRLYGNGKNSGELKLHAKKLSFNHPLSGEKMTFLSVVPF